MPYGEILVHDGACAGGTPGRDLVLQDVAAQDSADGGRGWALPLHVDRRRVQPVRLHIVHFTRRSYKSRNANQCVKRGECQYNPRNNCPI